jgi:hypothetical protein
MTAAGSDSVAALIFVSFVPFVFDQPSESAGRR